MCAVLIPKPHLKREDETAPARTMVLDLKKDRSFGKTIWSPLLLRFNGGSLTGFGCVTATNWSLEERIEKS